MDHKADRFIDNVCAQAFDSAAVNHSYLRALNMGDFPNVDLALQDFAFQYGLYSGKFTEYVSAVIGNLSDAQHQRILRANLAEERGETDDVDLPPDVLASIAGRPHSLLYQRFQQALGVDARYVKTAQRCVASESWGRQFLDLCQANECVGVGAIGIGTELIVSRIYDQILGGLKRHSSLSISERVFFDLHAHCDEAHAAQLLTIAKELAVDSASCEQIEYGAKKAIELRAAFWDEMLVRAQNFPAPDASIAEKAAALAH